MAPPPPLLALAAALAAAAAAAAASGENLALLTAEGSSHGRRLLAASPDLPVLQDFESRVHNPKILSSWVGNDPCASCDAPGGRCLWYGIQCVVFGGVTRVSSLIVVNANLNGTLPYWLGNMTSLTTLSLYGNRLIGTIPASISKIYHLLYLNLNHNFLTGPIPSKFYNPQVIREIHLCSNNLTGNIPEAIVGFYGLQVLTLDYNNLNGTIPNIEFIKGLQKIQVSHNKLTGVTPFSRGFSRHNPELTHADFSYNNLTGLFPSDLVLCTKLQVLRVPRLLKHILSNIGHNQFQGTIQPSQPSIYQAYHCSGHLTKFDVSYNNFQGIFPPDLLKYSPHLTWVDVTGNYLVGVAPNASFVHCSNNCLTPPAKYQRPASVCAALPNILYSAECSNLACRAGVCTFMGVNPNAVGNLCSSFPGVKLTMDYACYEARCSRQDITSGSSLLVEATAMGHAISRSSTTLPEIADQPTKTLIAPARSARVGPAMEDTMVGQIASPGLPRVPVLS
eukprot:SM000463S16147  [mRNA]  locus=s463:1497:7665:- [translate_table: standard]